MNPGPGTPVFIPQKETTASKVYDLYHRPLRDVRISVIDQCNFRCAYCMPANNGTQPYTFLKKDQWLSFGQIERLAVLFVRLGVGKIRLTGGEPTVRRDLETIVERLNSLRPQGLKYIGMTTNGIVLKRRIRPLVDAGLNVVNISLDTLDANKFEAITRRQGLSNVLAAIDAACVWFFLDHVRITSYT